MFKKEIFSTYLRMEQLTDEVKKAHKIKLGAKVPRYDVVAIAGYYRSLEAIKNTKGQIIFYLNETRGVIDSPDQRRADRFLMGKNSLNFSSIFLLNNTNSIIGYGTPNEAKTYGKDKQPNPFFDCKNDGYLFIISSDWRFIEVLVIPNGKYTILGNAQQMADGVFNEALQTMRTAATTFYNY